MLASRSKVLARGKGTYQDVIDAPAHQVAEIVDGTLYSHPRPAPPHAIASSVLGGELNPPFHRGRGGPGGRWILNEPELHVGEDILVPDLVGRRRERNDGRKRRGITGCGRDLTVALHERSARVHQDKHRRQEQYSVRWSWNRDVSGMLTTPLGRRGGVT